MVRCDYRARNLFISHADGEKLYESKERTYIPLRMIMTINAEMGMDLDMNENLMKLLGEVEILTSGGSRSMGGSTIE